jgi:hypothetical protein
METFSENADYDDDFDLSSVVEKSSNINVPIGHIIVSQKWRGSELHQRLKSKQGNRYTE